MIQSKTTSTTPFTYTSSFSDLISLFLTSIWTETVFCRVGFFFGFYGFFGSVFFVILGILVKITQISLCCCCCFARLMWEFYSHHCKKIAYSFKDSAQATAITEVLTVASNWTTEAQGRNFNLTHRIMVLKHKMKPIDQTKSITWKLQSTTQL